jgi:hypothetical protein
MAQSVPNPLKTAPTPQKAADEALIAKPPVEKQPVFTDYASI